MAAGNEKAENPEHHDDSYFANVHEDFREADEVKGLISSLPDIYKDQVAVETSAERFTCALTRTQLLFTFHSVGLVHPPPPPPPPTLTIYLDIFSAMHFRLAMVVKGRRI